MQSRVYAVKVIIEGSDSNGNGVLSHGGAADVVSPLAVLTVCMNSFQAS
jgi:hypothetical protein